MATDRQGKCFLHFTFYSPKFVRKPTPPDLTWSHFYNHVTFVMRILAFRPMPFLASLSCHIINSQNAEHGASTIAFHLGCLLALVGATDCGRCCEVDASKLLTVLTSGCGLPSSVDSPVDNGPD